MTPIAIIWSAPSLSFPHLCRCISAQPVCKSFSHKDQGKACLRAPLYLNWMHVCMRVCVCALFGGVNDTEWRLQSVSFISWRGDIQSRHLHIAFVSLSRSALGLSVSCYRTRGEQTLPSLRSSFFKTVSTPETLHRTCSTAEKHACNRTLPHILVDTLLRLT